MRICVIYSSECRSAQCEEQEFLFIVSVLWKLDKKTICVVFKNMALSTRN